MRKGPIKLIQQTTQIFLFKRAEIFENKRDREKEQSHIEERDFSLLNELYVGILFYFEFLISSILSVRNQNEEINSNGIYSEIPIRDFFFYFILILLTTISFPNPTEK